MRSIKLLLFGNSNFKLLIVLIVVQHLFLYAKINGIEKKERSNSKWQLTAYNYSELGNLKPEEQLKIIHNKGHKKMIARDTTEENVQIQNKIIAESNKIKDFTIQPVFIQYSFYETETVRNIGN